MAEATEVAHSRSSPIHIAVLISGVLRYANETFLPNIRHLESLNPNAKFHVYAAISPKSRFDSTDTKEGQGLSEQLIGRQSKPPSTELLRQIFGHYLVGSTLTPGPYEYSTGHLVTSQQARLRLMRWRMSNVFGIMEEGLRKLKRPHAYEYVVWMRPDTVVNMTVPFAAVDIGLNVHALPGVPTMDWDWFWWGTPAAMKALMVDFKKAALYEKCVCRGDYGTIKPNMTVYGFPRNWLHPQVCDKSGTTPYRHAAYCIIFQHMWALKPSRAAFFVGYGAAALYGRRGSPPTYNPFKAAAATSSQLGAGLPSYTDGLLRTPFGGPFSPPWWFTGEDWVFSHKYET